TFAEVGNVNYVWMTNGGGGASFAFESRDGFALLQHLIAEYVRANGLDGDLASDQILIASEIDLAHRSATESFLEPVTRRQQRRPREGMLGARVILGTGDYAVVITGFATRTLAHKIKRLSPMA